VRRISRGRILFLTLHKAPCARLGGGPFRRERRQTVLLLPLPSADERTTTVSSIDPSAALPRSSQLPAAPFHSPIREREEPESGSRPHSLSSVRAGLTHLAGGRKRGARVKAPPSKTSRKKVLASKQLTAKKEEKELELDIHPVGEKSSHGLAAAERERGFHKAEPKPPPGTEGGFSSPPTPSPGRFRRGPHPARGCRDRRC